MQTITMAAPQALWADLGEAPRGLRAVYPVVGEHGLHRPDGLVFGQAVGGEWAGALAPVW